MAELDRWENEGGMIGYSDLPPRLRALKRQYRRMHALVDQEQEKPNACEIELRRLKREKLYLKDQIASLSAMRG